MADYKNWKVGMLHREDQHMNHKVPLAIELSQMNKDFIKRELQAATTDNKSAFLYL